jgi:PAS domain S-box-containing protein
MENKEGANALFQFATEGILITNNLGEIVEINPSAEKLFGYESGELVGKKIEILIPKKAAQKHHEHRNNYNTNPHPRSMGIGIDLFGLKKNGEEFPVEISLSPYQSEEGNFVIAFIIDITIRKKNEDAVKQQKAELEKMNSELEKKVKDRTMILEEAIEELNGTKEELKEALENEKELNDLKSRFVAMASHEFRTPLATILSSLSLVSKYGELDDKEKQTKHIGRIKSSINSLTDIINDVLSISKLEEGKIIVSPENFDVKDFIQTQLQDLKSVAQVGQTINYTHLGNAEIVFDKRILKHLLFNLVSNAIKFTGEGKSIEVASSVAENNFSLTVKDNGIGISTEDQERLFERFFRAQNATNIQGTGLGLSIVAKYVELLNGTIDFKSELEKGSTFIITIPTNKL